MTGNFRDRLHKNPGADKTKKLCWCAEKCIHLASDFSGAVGILKAHIKRCLKKRGIQEGPSEKELR